MSGVNSTVVLPTHFFAVKVDCYVLLKERIHSLRGKAALDCFSVGILLLVLCASARFRQCGMLVLVGSVPAIC